MAGLLFLLEVLAILMVAFWLWGQEHPGGRRRLRLFDARIGETAPPKTAEPAWRTAKAPRSAGGGVRTPAPPKRGRPGWRGS